MPRNRHQARIAADLTLQANIDAEAATRQDVDETLQANIDTVTNYLRVVPTTTLV